MRWARRGSYFYVIDAFIASIIIIAGVAIMFSQYSDGVETTTAFFSAEDFFAVVEDTEVRNVDNIDIKNWTRDGTINDSSRTLLEQLAFFNASGQGTECRTYAQILIADLPENVDGRILIQNSVMAETANPKSTPEESLVFFSSKRIVLVRGSPWEVFPPVLIEVQTWQ